MQKKAQPLPMCAQMSANKTALNFNFTIKANASKMYLIHAHIPQIKF